MKAEIQLTGLLGASALVVFFCGQVLVAGWQVAFLWLVQAALLWFWVCRAVWQRRELNRINVDACLLPQLGLANRLTILRGFLIALTGGFLWQPQTPGFIGWLPGMLYGAAAILDRLDGFVARKTGQTTLLGAYLDTCFDALGLLVAPLLAVGFGKVHWSYLLLSVAFYIFQWGQSWREQRFYPVHGLMPSQLRRALAGFQMGFIAAVLLPCFHGAQTFVCGFAFMLPALLGFTVDWLVVCGVINTQAAITTRFFTRLADLSAGILQPLLRLVVVTSVCFKVDLLAQAPLSTAVDTVLMSGLLLGASLVLLGWAGRIGALIIVLLLNAYFSTVTAVDIVLLCSAVWVLLLGTGRFSLWQWDDAWVNRQDGAASKL